MQYLHYIVKFHLLKLGCTLTWFENAVLQLHCTLNESKSLLWKLLCASEIKKIKLRLLHRAFTG